LLLGFPGVALSPGSDFAVCVNLEPASLTDCGFYRKTATGYRPFKPCENFFVRGIRRYRIAGSEAPLIALFEPKMREFLLSASGDHIA